MYGGSSMQVKQSGGQSASGEINQTPIFILWVIPIRVYPYCMALCLLVLVGEVHLLRHHQGAPHHSQGREPVPNVWFSWCFESILTWGSILITICKDPYTCWLLGQDPYTCWVLGPDPYIHVGSWVRIPIHVGPDPFPESLCMYY